MILIKRILTAGRIASGALALFVFTAFAPAGFGVWTLGQDPLWTLSPEDRDYLTTGYSERGLAYNPATGNVYVTHSSASDVAVIAVLDGETGDHLGELSVEGIEGGFRPVRMIAASPSGAIFAGNHTVDPASDPFVLYRWENEEADPELVWEGDPSDGIGSDNFGRNLALREFDNELQVLLIGRTADDTPQIVALLTSGDGGETFESETIQTEPAAQMELGSAFGEGDTFWGSRAGRPLQEFDFEGNLLRAFDEALLRPVLSQIAVDTERNLLAAVGDWTPHLHLYNLETLSGEEPNSTLASRVFPTNNDNIERTGAVVFGGDVVYALDTNNGIMAYEMTLPPEPEPGVVWRILPGERSYMTTGYNERGLAYNPATRNVYVQHFNSDTGELSVNIVDGMSGEHLGELSVDGVEGGANPLRKIAVSEDGTIFAGNQTLDAGADPYRLYRWDAEEDDPVVVWEGDPSAGISGVLRRYGDNLALRGAAEGTLEVLLIPDFWQQEEEPHAVAVLSSTDGGGSFDLTTIETEPTTRFGLGADFGEGDTFWGTRAGQPLREFDFDGELLREFTGDVFPAGISPIRIDLEERIFAGKSGNTIQLFDFDTLSPERDNVPVASQSFATSNPNVETTGDIAFGDEGIIYALDTNNGVMAFVPVLEPEPIEPGHIYWANNSGVRAADAEGGDPRTVATGLIRAIGVAIDPVNDYVFWAEDGGGRLWRANSDATEPTVIVNIETVDGAGGQFVDVNPELERVYWAEWTKGLFSANYDGTDVRHLIDESGNQTTGVTVDRETGRVYLGSAAEGQVWRVEADGSGLTTVATLGDNTYGLAVDPERNRLYHTNFSAGTLSVLELESGEVSGLLDGLGQPLGVALSEGGNRLYWTERTDGRIRTALTAGDGAGEPETLMSGEDSPFGIAARPEALETFNAWIAAQGVPEGQRGPADDPDGDGVLNIVEYALGLDPLSSSREALPVPSVENIEGADYLTLSVNRNPEATGITYVIEVSSDLETWESGSEATTVIEATETVLTVRDNTAVPEAGKRFIRLRITQP